MKILAYDIETSPNLGYVWGLFQQNLGLNQIVSVTEMLCFGAQWVTIENGEITPGEYVFAASWHVGGRPAMVRKLHALFDEADAVLHFNGVSFDDKHARREFVEHGLLPPSPYKSIDLMRIAKAAFKFPSNKLDYIAGKLLGEHKVQTGGFALWEGVMKGEKWAQDKMEEYQRQDVELLPRLLVKLLPWANVFPNVPLINGDYHIDSEPRCTRCESPDVQWRGYRSTAASLFKQYVCKACGSWGRVRTRSKGSATQEAKP